MRRGLYGLRPRCLGRARPRIARLARLLGATDGAFFFGSAPLYCDFGVYHVLSNTALLEPECIDAHPKLREFMFAFEALPGVKQYLAVRPRPVDIGVAPKLEPNLAGSRTLAQPLL